MFAQSAVGHGQCFPHLNKKTQSAHLTEFTGPSRGGEVLTEFSPTALLPPPAGGEDERGGEEEGTDDTAYLITIK